MGRANATGNNIPPLYIVSDISGEYDLLNGAQEECLRLVGRKQEYINITLWNI